MKSDVTTLSILYEKYKKVDSRPRMFKLLDEGNPVNVWPDDDKKSPFSQILYT